MDEQENTEQTNSDNSGFTAPPGAPGQAESRASRARLEVLLDARRVRPEPNWQEASEEPVAWEAMYRDLLEERTEEGRPRWDWRKALYVAWSCLPTGKRWPRYEYELATDFLGLTNTRTIRQWKEKDPEIEERIAKGPKELLLGHVADVLEALVKVASDPDPKAFQDRRLFLEMTQQYKPRSAQEITGEDGEPIEMKHKLDGEQFAALMHQAKVLATTLAEQAESGWNADNPKQAQ